MIQGGGAIAEEVDYTQGNTNVNIGGFFQQRSGNLGRHGTVNADDIDSFADATGNHPSGMQIHRNERRSAVRLKHGNDGANSSQLNKTTNHTVS